MASPRSSSSQSTPRVNSRIKILLLCQNKVTLTSDQSAAVDGVYTSIDEIFPMIFDGDFFNATSTVVLLGNSGCGKTTAINGSAKLRLRGIRSEFLKKIAEDTANSDVPVTLQSLRCSGSDFYDVVLNRSVKVERNWKAMVCPPNLNVRTALKTLNVDKIKEFLNIPKSPGTLHNPDSSRSFTYELYRRANVEFGFNIIDLAGFETLEQVKPSVGGLSIRPVVVSKKILSEVEAVRTSKIIRTTLAELTAYLNRDRSANTPTRMTHSSFFENVIYSSEKLYIIIPIASDPLNFTQPIASLAHAIKTRWLNDCCNEQAIRRIKTPRRPMKPQTTIPSSLPLTTLPSGRKTIDKQKATTNSSSTKKSKPIHRHAGRTRPKKVESDHSESEKEAAVSDCSGSSGEEKSEPDRRKLSKRKTPELVISDHGAPSGTLVHLERRDSIVSGNHLHNVTYDVHSTEASPIERPDPRLRYRMLKTSSPLNTSTTSGCSEDSRALGKKSSDNQSNSFMEAIRDVSHISQGSVSRHFSEVGKQLSFNAELVAEADITKILAVSSESVATDFEQISKVTECENSKTAPSVENLSGSATPSGDTYVYCKYQTRDLEENMDDYQHYILSHFVSASEIYAIPESQLSVVTKIDFMIEQIAAQIPQMESHKIISGIMCLVKLKKVCLRAVIKSVDRENQSAKVFTIDRGTTRSLPFSQIHKITQSLTTVVSPLIHCHIVPTPLVQRNIRVFKKLLKESSFGLVITETLGVNEYKVELCFDRAVDEEIILRQELDNAKRAAEEGNRATEETEWLFGLPTRIVIHNLSESHVKVINKDGAIWRPRIFNQLIAPTHFRKTSSNVFICQKCQAEFSSTICVKEHILLLHTDLKYICAICAPETLITFNAMSNALRHCRNVHGAGDQKKKRKKSTIYQRNSSNYFHLTSEYA